MNIKKILISLFLVIVSNFCFIINIYCINLYDNLMLPDIVNTKSYTNNLLYDIADFYKAKKIKLYNMNYSIESIDSTFNPDELTKNDFIFSDNNTKLSAPGYSNYRIKKDVIYDIIRNDKNQIINITPKMYAEFPKNLLSTANDLLYVYPSTYHYNSNILDMRFNHYPKFQFEKYMFENGLISRKDISWNYYNDNWVESYYIFLYKDKKLIEIKSDNSYVTINYRDNKIDNINIYSNKNSLTKTLQYIYLDKENTIQITVKNQSDKKHNIKEYGKIIKFKDAKPIIIYGYKLDFDNIIHKDEYGKIEFIY